MLTPFEVHDNRRLPSEISGRILTLLQNLRGIEPLRQLFWVELNYHRIDDRNLVETRLKKAKS